jgi:hypothetical protein
MNANVRSEIYSCPDCRADVPASAVLCWRCRRVFPKGPRAEGAIVVAEGVNESLENRTKFQFTLASILLILTFAAVLMSIIVTVPGLGILLAILSVPALARTAYVSMYRGSRGRPLTIGEKAGIFIAWISLGLVVLVATGVAFFVSCLAIFASGSSAGYGPGPAAVIIGVIVALLTAIFLLVYFWRKIKY